MADRWLLIETFGGEGHEEPTVIAHGRSKKGLVPLATVLGRGRYLHDIRALVARVVRSGAPVRTATSDGARRLIGDPLVAFTGRVHGVYVWQGPPDGSHRRATPRAPGSSTSPPGRSAGPTTCSTCTASLPSTVAPNGSSRRPSPA